MKSLIWENVNRGRGPGRRELLDEMCVLGRWGAGMWEGLLVFCCLGVLVFWSHSMWDLSSTDQGLEPAPALHW